MNRFKLTVTVLGIIACASLSGSALAQTFSTGDVLISIGNSHIKWYHHDGTYVATLDNTSGSCETVGMYVDPSGKLYGAEWTTSTMSKFNSDGTLQTHPWGSGFSAPWGLVGDGAGNIYVGNGSNKLQQFDVDGNLLAYWYPPASYGIQGMDISDDGSTLYYLADWSGSIKRFDVTTGSQLTDFTGYTGHFLYSMRLLPDGGALASDLSTNQVNRYNSSGSIVQTYNEPSGEAWAAICLDPDGTSFWGTNYGNGHAHQIRLSDGAELSSISAGNECYATGMTIVGEHCAAPAVTTDPTDQSICSGGTATFTAAASGSSPTVQWQQSTDNGGSWTDMGGETSNSVSVTATTSSSGTEYHAVYTNGCGTATSAAATLTVGALPTISVSLSSTLLWPANHSMRAITATVTTGGCSYCGDLTVTLVSVTSNEADNGLGDGDTPNDVQNASTGTDDRTFSVRAERSALGAGGRTYTATYRVSDCAGNTATASATVNVPHSH